jgi:restriction system protein
MPKVRRQPQRKRRRKPAPPTVAQIYTRIELADNAIKKLFLGEQLTDEEYSSLIDSDYLLPSPDEAAQDLYSPSTLQLVDVSAFLFTGVEREVLQYFARHPELLFSLRPRKFEEVIAAIFRNHGYDVELTPESRDGGVDILAVRKSDLTGRSLNLIECKRYEPSNKVGIGIVQRMLGVVDHHRATKGIIVTTSTFSRDAEEFAKNSRYRLELSDYAALSTWLKGLNPSARA